MATPGRHPEGRIEPGLYVAGWLRRGPRGAIPDQRADAQQLARIIADDLLAQPEGPRPEFSLPEGVVDILGWRRIDLRERLNAAPGRARQKLRLREEQLAAAADVTLEPTVEDSASQDTTRIDHLLTVAFATESGGAELVAEDLHRSLSPRGDAELLDLSAATVDDLDPNRFHSIICSTYGDGELPTGIRGLCQRIIDETPNLEGLRYAIFGMGDRSYTKTYSRGSELLDEALTACGAQRIGEYGRHDAGGSIEASDAATDWLEGVTIEAFAAEVATVSQ